jgi:hypothetical protein
MTSDRAALSPIAATSGGGTRRGLRDAKRGADVMSEPNDHEAAVSRRSLTTLLGAAGAAVLAGCAGRAAADEITGTISAADTVAGALPSIAGAPRARGRGGRVVRRGPGVYLCAHNGGQALLK